GLPLVPVPWLPRAPRRGMPARSQAVPGAPARAAGGRPGQQAEGRVKLALVVALAGGVLSSTNRHVEQGNRLYGEGKLADALREYDRAARALPEEPGVRFNRGAALYGLGKFDEAQKEFLRATE